MMQWDGYGLIREVIKVKAHQDIGRIECPLAKVRAIGNDHADKGAKMALGLHPGSGEEDRREVAASIARASSRSSPASGRCEWPRERRCSRVKRLFHHISAAPHDAP